MTFDLFLYHRFQKKVSTGKKVVGLQTVGSITMTIFVYKSLTRPVNCPHHRTVKQYSLYTDELSDITEGC